MDQKTSKSGELFNPFPGLRPFSHDEAHLFFGREGQSRSVLQSLKSNDFVAVIGASGTGKSSLIYCGVIPELLSQNEKEWLTVSTRPGSTPIRNLVYAVNSKFKKEVDEKEVSQLIDGNLTLNDWLGKTVDKNKSLLLVVDQFEEIFRYKQVELAESGHKEIERFVQIIYEACTLGEKPVSVVLTMRSDFIGECAVFQDLTDLINRSNYLIPQMTRADFRKAIEGPVEIGGAKIEEKLVNQLLDEVGNNTDQLPVLQHSLMRTWDYWALQNDPEKPIDTGDYEAIGRMEKALSDHANEAYDELDEDQRQICESLFKTITEKGGDNRGVRRPTKIIHIADITRRTPEEIVGVAEVFRSKGRTFLTPFHPIVLEEETVIDISHESLMRIWDRLRLWVDEEASSVQMYKKLSNAAALYQEGKGGLWRPPDLQLALNWRENQQPTAKWAIQYDPAFERSMVYLETSEKEFRKEEENKIRLQKRRLRVTRMFSLILGGIAIIAMGLFIWTRDLQTEAEAQRNEAVQQTKLAKESAAVAERERLAAELARDSADTERQRAIEASELAEDRRKQAVEATDEALKQQQIAASNAVAATKAQKEALAAADAAEKERQRAVEASQEALKRRMLSIAQSIAVKSTQMRTDTLLKGLLAYQAYSFNKQYEGIDYDPDIFGSIYSGMKFFNGNGYNVYKAHNSTVGSMLDQNGATISASSEGKILKWQPGDTSSTIIRSDLPTIKKILYGNPSLICLTNRTIQPIGDKFTDEDIYEFPLYTLNDLFYTNEGRYIKVYNNRLDITEDYKSEGYTFFETDLKINAVEFDQESGNLIVALSDGTIHTWTNFHTGSEDPETLAVEPSANWSALKFLSDRGVVAAGTGNSLGTIYLWDLSTGELLNALRGHNAKITGIVFSSEGDLMSSSSYDGSVNLWHMDDLNTLPIKFSDHNTWVTAVMFSSDDKSIISGDKNGNLRVFPTVIESIVGEYCQFLSRNLSEGEWQNYVGTDIPYNPAKCNNQ